MVCHRGMEHSDHELVTLALGGSRDAGEVLFRRHWPHARRVAHAVCGRSSLGDEVAQEAMVQAFSSLGRFRGDGPFAAWLRRIVVTRSLNALRAERRLAPLDDAELAGTEDRPHIPDARLVAAVGALSQEHRVVVALRYGADMTPPEIADALGVAVGTVNSRLGRALARLREVMEVADV